mmetsp:Transcript_1394/g.3054  ORF Transcript_1394/g.3054 Transcript_1394/m.3054 type:complete len:345 (-) Transcript_1394:5843-6877(-)
MPAGDGVDLHVQPQGRLFDALEGPALPQPHQQHLHPVLQRLHLQRGVHERPDMRRSPLVFRTQRLHRGQGLPDQPGLRHYRHAPLQRDRLLPLLRRPQPDLHLSLRLQRRRLRLLVRLHLERTRQPASGEPRDVRALAGQHQLPGGRHGREQEAHSDRACCLHLLLHRLHLPLPRHHQASRLSDLRWPALHVHGGRGDLLPPPHHRRERHYRRDCHRPADHRRQPAHPSVRGDRGREQGDRKHAVLEQPQLQPPLPQPRLLPAPPREDQTLRGHCAQLRSDLRRHRHGDGGGKRPGKLRGHRADDTDRRREQECAGAGGERQAANLEPRRGPADRGLGLLLPQP